MTLKTAITQTMAIAVARAIYEIDPDATVRAEMSSHQIMIDGDVTEALANAALAKAQCEFSAFEPAADSVHIQGGHTSCGHCA